MKYLPVFVLKHNLGDSSRNGVTETHENQLVIECENGYMTLENVRENDYVILKEDVLYPNDERRYVRYYPEHLENNHMRMFGGSFVYTSDSRFPHKYAMPVHDRVE